MKTPEAQSIPGSGNLAFLEEMYESFLQDPASVPPDYRDYFSTIANGDRPIDRRPHFRAGSLFSSSPAHVPAGEDPGLAVRVASLQDKVNQLIRNYRMRGHMIARLDPLGMPRPCPPDLEPEFIGLSESELDQVVCCESLQYDQPLSIRGILERLRNTYCRSIGVQYMHIDDLSMRRWLQRRMEATENRLQLSREEQIRILTRLTDAVTFEEFIRKKFVGAKSFSLEGSESLIPLLDLAIEKASSQGIQEIVFGMAHRGRLNVLANIMGKNPGRIFREFADADPGMYRHRGDVKYHLGYSSDYKTLTGKKVHLSLCFNPSHLEFVNPVVLGRVRSKQDRLDDEERRRCLALLIHGDAAMAGEGVVQETLNLSQLEGYKVGGTLHVVVNNQLGFTTAPDEARSSRYASDIGKMLQIPIFLVNGEDPEAVAQCVRLALDFRAEFQRDVIIDMYGYRRLGHNEGDEPSFTQPLLYRAIEKRKPVREGYLEHLLKLNGVTQDEADDIASKRRDHLEKELSKSKSDEYKVVSDGLHGIWEGYLGGNEADVPKVETGVDRAVIQKLLQQLTEVPKNFQIHPKLQKWMQQRQAMARGEAPLDWSAGEAAALATLSSEGYRVRLSGQDSGRGTFSHRHAILIDYETGARFCPLEKINRKKPVQICNSPLSEIGVLGFDYGYSLDCPDGLVLWEAQFGDFSNVAQVIIDQFLVSGEEKWNRLSGLVLLLPHGYEGQGPEHSSARLERFLALAAEDNIQVVYPTTPAQFFHVLRRQVVRKWRKPLVVMTPKSLLRHPEAISPIDELASGAFHPLLSDPKPPASRASRILFCTGKIFYELDQYRRDQKIQDVVIHRLEQLYPLPSGELKAALAAHPDAKCVWVQEEPENMGAWPYLKSRGDAAFSGRPLIGVCRPESASPATGSATSHKQEQQQVVQEAFQRA